MHKCTTFLLLVALLVPPLGSEARSRSIDADRLDDDPVDEIPIPVLFGVEYDDINPDFGDPRGGGTRLHEGEDFLAPQGTPIVSPTEAIVLSTGTGPSAGKYVYTLNPGGERFRYMHLDYIADLDRGDVLDAGDFIGTVGDTGNAPDGVYHLHFETRDDNNDPQDPYDRLVDGFTRKEKMSFLRDIFRDIRDDEEYAEFLVTTFPNEFRAALQADYDLPRAVERALKEEGLVDQAAALAQLQTLLSLVPARLTSELGNGDSGKEVILLQLFLIFNTTGAERDRLAAAGPTGYYGPITAAAVAAYQLENDLAQTGRYDRATRGAML